MKRSDQPLHVHRILLAILFLGAMFALLKGRELGFSIVGGITIAAIFVAVGVIIELVLRWRYPK